MKKLLTLISFCISIPGWTQTDTLLQIVPEEDLLENFVQDQEEETFDYNTAFEHLELLRRRPLDLNSATENDLDELPFLTDIQKLNLLDYRKMAGDLISIYELQAVPGFDIATIQRILPFITVAPKGALIQSLKSWRTEGRNQLLLRWARTLEAQQGFTVPEEDSTASRYSGDRNRLYVRYKFFLYDRLSVGFTAEKDAGEEFFGGSNKKGFDFYSAHLFLKNPTERIKAIALGDYSVSMGQGLLVYQGFAAGKSALVTGIQRSKRQLRPYTSVNEFDFYRGAGATFGLTKKLELTAFASSRRRDANRSGEIDPLEPDFGFVTSLQTSGLHRTKSEIEDEKAIRQTSAGGSLRYERRRWHIAANGLFEHLDKPLQSTPALYNKYYFSGQQLLNFSLDYGLTYRNFRFFGETARSDNGAVATLNGVLVAVSRKMDFALLHRHFPKDYQALNPKPFAETSGGRNEDGLYFGMSVRPLRNWKLDVYYDQWNHSWPRFNVDAPSQGHEWLGRLTYSIRRKMEAYLQVKNEVKEENADAETGPFSALSTRKRFYSRLHVSWKLTKSLEWRSRLDAGFTEFEGEKKTGTALSQDLIYRAIGSPFSFSTRFAIFDTDGYDVRFYSYENDLLYDFSIPAYYNRGTRFYFNLRYRMLRSLTLEGRFARTYYTNVEVVGSGLDEINGPAKTDVKLQVKWEF